MPRSPEFLAAKFLEEPSEVQLGNACEGKRHWLQMWGNWHERRLHPDTLLKLKQHEPGPLLWWWVGAAGRVDLGAIRLAVAGAGTHERMQLSESGKCYRPQL